MQRRAARSRVRHARHAVRAEEDAVDEDERLQRDQAAEGAPEPVDHAELVVGGGDAHGEEGDVDDAARDEHDDEVEHREEDDVEVGLVRHQVELEVSLELGIVTKINFELFSHHIWT